MKLEELKDWNKLSPQEQSRLREVYGDNPHITKTMAEKPPVDSENPRDKGEDHG